MSSKVPLSKAPFSSRAPLSRVPGRSRILVVDDEPGLLRAAQRILEPTYEVAIESCPAQALETAASLHPDLAICDIRMPEMDGFTFADRLRERLPGVEIIFMTG